MSKHIRIYAVPVQEHNDDLCTFTFNHSTLGSSAYAGRYRAELQGNILTLINKEYPSIVRKYALSYDISSHELHRAWIGTGEKAKACRILQNMVMLQILQLIRKINGAL